MQRRRVEGKENLRLHVDRQADVLRSTTVYFLRALHARFYDRILSDLFA